MQWRAADEARCASGQNRHTNSEARQDKESNTMTWIGVILGSTLPGRNGELARWVLDHATERSDVIRPH